MKIKDSDFEWLSEKISAKVSELNAEIFSETELKLP